MRSFGPKGKKQPPAPREPFEFTVMRDDEPETHEFNARAVTDIAALTQTLAASEKHPERQLSGMTRLVEKMLDNKDGTPATWAPKMEPLPEGTEDALARRGVPVGDGQGSTEQDERDERLLAELEFDESGQPVRKFRGPDGELHEWNQDNMARFTAFAAGSSRRRWRYVMNDDDEVVVDMVDLVKLFEWMVGLAAGRPTQPSS